MNLSNFLEKLLVKIDVVTIKPRNDHIHNAYPLMHPWIQNPNPDSLIVIAIHVQTWFGPSLCTLIHVNSHCRFMTKNSFVGNTPDLTYITDRCAHIHNSVK